MPEIAGVHLLQPLDLVSSPRRSAVAVVDLEGRLRALDLAADDDDLLGRIPAGADWVVVDAPLAVPNETGRREVETVLSWCDVPAFPVSARRLAQVHGGARGPGLAAGLARPGRTVRETLPELVLREIAWERDHPPGAAPMDLADYRAAWLGVRPPAYRPKGRGRARPAGLLPAWELLSGVLDLGGWVPAGGDDWQSLHDAARLDALCCAYAGLRLARGEHAVSIGSDALGHLTFPADANLRGRVGITLRRLGAEGSLRIPTGEALG
jgi:predicted nuclease with RNAse H fold